MILPTRPTPESYNYITQLLFNFKFAVFRAFCHTDNASLTLTQPAAEEGERKKIQANKIKGGDCVTDKLH